MTGLFELIIESILSPPLMFFVLGIVAILVKSDLKIPDSVGLMLGVFLLTAIGIRSGVGIAEVGIGAAIVPALAAIFLGFLIPFIGYFILTKLAKFDPANAGCYAGHFGAVSAATLAVVLAYAYRVGLEYEAFIPALYPFMDTTALITGIILGKIGMSRLSKESDYVQTAVPLYQVIKEAATGKGVFLLFGGLLIGYIAGADGANKIMPFYDTMFYGVLTLFLLDIGLMAGKRLAEFKKVGLPVIIFALIMVPIHGILGIIVGLFINLSVGGTLILATMAASASYISAPAVMRAALPTSNPSIALKIAVLVVFPFNASVGIPLYHYITEILVRFI